MTMTRKKKITAIVLLVLLGIVFVPLLFLKAWGAYKLGEVNAQQTAQGTLISQANTPPEGKNLFEQPLWLDRLKEQAARNKKLSGEENAAAGLQPNTNALSRWCTEQGQKMSHYEIFKPRVDKKVVPQPGNLDSTQRELLPTFEALQKGPERASNQPMPPELSSIIEKYEARKDLSDEEKVLAVFQEYFQSEDTATEAEIKKSLAESSFFGDSAEVYIKQGLPEKDYLSYPLASLASLKALAQHYGHTARWQAYLGQREKTLEELQPLLNLASLEGHNSTLIEGLVRISSRAIAANAVHAIIRENVLNEEDLLSIQTRFSRMNVMEDLRQTLEGEEAYCEKMYRVEFDPSFKGSFWQRSFARLAHFSGYMNLNKAATFKAMRGFRAAVDTESQTLDYAAWKTAEDLPESMFNNLARETISGDGKASILFLRVQSQRDAVILACALERYRMQEGSFPEKLEALIPEYLPQMPPGSLSLGSLSYKPVEGGYELILNKLPELPADKRMETIWRR